MTTKEKFKVAGFVLATASTVAVSTIEFAQHPIAFPCVLTAAALGLGALSLKRRSERNAKAKEQAIKNAINRLDKKEKHKVAVVAEILGITADGTLITPEVEEAIKDVNIGNVKDTVQLAKVINDRQLRGEKLTPELVKQVKDTLKIQNGR